MTTGAYRLLDIVGDTGVPCGTYASGIITEKYPELLKRIDSDGHFIGAHAWAQNIIPVYQDRADEEADLARGSKASSLCSARRHGALSARAERRAPTRSSF